MNPQITKKQAASIEFRVITGSFLLVMILSCVDMARISVGTPLVDGLGYAIFKYTIAYVCYLLLFFSMAPAFEKKEGNSSGSTFLVLLLILFCIQFGIIGVYVVGLLAIKILFLYFNRNRDNKENRLAYEVSLLAGCWMLLVAAVLYLAVPASIAAYILLGLPAYIIYGLPAAITLYLYSVYSLIPRVVEKRGSIFRYSSAMLLNTAASCLVILVLILLFQSRIYPFPSNGFPSMNGVPFADRIENMIIITIIINLIVQVMVVMPVSWSVYKARNNNREEEIRTLKTELGKSDASLHFLKSQINPHFLFNALNTLYGTALQENAERTGEGIQKLGDMMRFMLQENMQDKILLSRDLEYLKNYILLQQLRTSAAPGIDIQLQLEAPEEEFLIAPMLLIPFVENAFKHGISLLTASHIKISLQLRGNILDFDVHNSIHLKPDHDPEQGQSGIGLENVKQRLQLLYPGRHELLIRQTAGEFFVHLTLQLERIN
jgi:heme/copper-type cytochrome/quinol oxidase subunit 2